MYGATDLQSPVWFRWLIGNVVCHTAHHIHFQVPFYRLHEAQEALNNEFHFKKISITEVWHLLGLGLWDEEKQKLVPIKNANK
jgi:fatty acid desaturase